MGFQNLYHQLTFLRDVIRWYSRRLYEIQRNNSIITQYCILTNMLKQNYKEKQIITYHSKEILSAMTLFWLRTFLFERASQMLIFCITSHKINEIWCLNLRFLLIYWDQIKQFIERWCPSTTWKASYHEIYKFKPHVVVAVVVGLVVELKECTISALQW